MPSASLMRSVLKRNVRHSWSQFVGPHGRIPSVLDGRVKGLRCTGGRVFWSSRRYGVSVMYLWKCSCCSSDICSSVENDSNASPPCECSRPEADAVWAAATPRDLPLPPAADGKAIQAKNSKRSSTITTGTDGCIASTDASSRRKCASASSSEPPAYAAGRILPAGRDAPAAAHMPPVQLPNRPRAQSASTPKNALSAAFLSLMACVPSGLI